MLWAWGSSDRSPLGPRPSAARQAGGLQKGPPSAPSFLRREVGAFPASVYLKQARGARPVRAELGASAAQRFLRGSARLSPLGSDVGAPAETLFSACVSSPGTHALPGPGSGLHAARKVSVLPAGNPVPAPEATAGVSVSRPDCTVSRADGTRSCPHAGTRGGDRAGADMQVSPCRRPGLEKHLPTNRALNLPLTSSRPAGLDFPLGSERVLANGAGLSQCN